MKIETRGFGIGGFLGVVAVVATAACEPAEQIDPGKPGIDDVAPTVSVRNDEALVLWHERSPNLVRASRFVSGSTWSSPITVATGTHPEVALSTTGKAFAVFVGPTGLEAAVRSGGVWGAPPAKLDTAVTSFSVGKYRVGTDGAGNGHALWSRAGIRTRLHLPAVGWQAPVVLDPDPSAGQVQLAVNEAGVAAAAWCRAGGIATARYVPATGWSGVDISTASCCVAHGFEFHTPALSVSISETGDAFVVASDLDRVCERHYTAATGWTPTTVISVEPQSVAPQVAVNSSGQALAAWLAGPLGSRALRIRQYTGGSWAAVRNGPSGIAVGPIGVGIHSNGGGAAIFRLGGTSGHINYVTCSSTGQLSSAVAMEQNLTSSSYYLRVGANPLVDSHGVTVWQRGGNEEVWASRLGI